MAKPYPRWRRTVIANEIVDDDWCLDIAQGRSVARIRRETGGQNDGRWFWAVQVDRSGRPFNGGTGYAATGAEARSLCEAAVPEEMRPVGAVI